MMNSDQLRELAEWHDERADSCVYEHERRRHQETADFIRQCAEQRPVVVPPGYKLVPIEPTPEMERAGGHANSEWLNDSAPIGEQRYAMPMQSVWRDMLAAAPQPSPADRCRSSETDDSKATSHPSPERPVSNREDAAAQVAAGSGEQPEQPQGHRRLPDSVRRSIERAIQYAEHPAGMSIHDGKARVDASHLRYLLSLADAVQTAQPQREPTEAQIEPLSEATIGALYKINMTLTEFARAVERAHGIGGSDAE